MLASNSPIKREISLVTMSFGACCRSTAFFDDFYHKLLTESPEIKQKFSSIDMDKQKSLIRTGINYLIMFASDSHIATKSLDKIGHIHDQNHVNVDKNMYKIWGKIFIQTVAKHDPHFNREVMMAWKHILTKGIKRLYEHYHVGSKRIAV